MTFKVSASTQISRSAQVRNAITKCNFEFHMVFVVYQVVN